MITKEEAQKIAKLARLKFEEDTVEKFSTQLSSIMNMIDILNEIDCKDIEPLTSVSNMNARMREDEVTSSDLSDKLLDHVSGQSAQLAKEVKYFITPKVIE
ncbi:aspartyl/glutamyl-tRNA amidotransferase subunit C [Rickettsia canadensis str. McKiel]|uniref:Aspartyl/glutamyl-tRNA(Asn/Gln) amidotransferase subunit C n=2 Tax=Rickettsia canadensis TaxID=788 RepID=GATC_RICCK|nr:Asp-tRNA(Asn)/Glu-tRNA(Gln) amidotransferase subunit GatC [Rickettsia canadensis]A8EXM2.1 RecName: Full=Aspartyl/glutamyl-tRNA(Asn/Gln) amidotransferase subunit C; Short=Asp/Glu-ADT subunit C [Rickettsia canadensis str. McKiel]ABV73105.1 aspartyl/glutamyl-tRNA amidotransferase subunit C [Rickettsia canadensis str. McKiel]AFB20731.1 aspartyl/glutamyl-tRNA amidotransferase subunit C [Rickettsia canadensis str. CA410]WQM43399.1 Asp-tRNA(Asn)/Glu-tRNA(Gln) amidotransferase subunit GatC [Ricketts